MTDLTNTLDDIRDIFSILHDATTSSWTGDKNLLILKINCEYLAERIDKSFKNFYVECKAIDKLEFHPWMNPISLPQILLTDINDIFKAELEILSADIENDFVKIICNQHNLDFDYCGGTLLLNCKTIKIFDQARRQLTITEFSKICDDYWNACSKELERSIIGRKNLTD